MFRTRTAGASASIGGASLVPRDRLASWGNICLRRSWVFERSETAIVCRDANSTSILTTVKGEDQGVRRI